MRYGKVPIQGNKRNFYTKELLKGCAIGYACKQGRDGTVTGKRFQALGNFSIAKNNP
ncbi:hypothetical protein HMPREF9444_01904 [Succinatimonas hippei YIT 12066]|uniref:Uncharacterized protein n=1 Tax=Succinatimonas hippei (strain DSM 22608 / JCM 16073 / KCTC 15190 / YIT 12066) TaxID=762983 RepID=E8LMB8_SUCHY|nr:hypothetical protein HMPREF9444_01904 [Succinatimonas hippei YIT 12066]